MPSLSEIEHEIGNVLAVVEELDEERYPTALEYLEELGIQEQDKVDAICFAVRRRKADIDFLKAEEKRLKQRRQAAEKRLQEFREYLCWVMEQGGLESLRGRKGAMWIRETASVEITDMDQLPAELVETKVQFSPRKPDIAKLLKDGQVVPGAELNSTKSLTIK